MRRNSRRHDHNTGIKSRLKSLEKSYAKLVSTGKKDEAAKALRTVTSALDKAAKKGVIHSSTASRKKSRLTVRLAAPAK